MDTELARTFLTVVSAGSFSAAASRLFVTQSTVSARVAALEDYLGCRLFVRNKAGTRLTPQGRGFRRHAVTLVRTAQRARQEIGIVKGFQRAVTIGGRFGLWDGLLLSVLPILQRNAPDLAIRAEIGFEEALMQGLEEGRIDIGVMYTPENRPGLRVEPLLEERLVLVASAASEPSMPGTTDLSYVYVDWGPEFAAQHSAAYPDHAGSGLTGNIGWLALQHILAAGGSGYFPARLVNAHVAQGQLEIVPDAPVFGLPGYLVYAEDAQQSAVGEAVQIIREVAGRLVEDGAAAGR